MRRRLSSTIQHMLAAAVFIALAVLLTPATALATIEDELYQYERITPTTVRVAKDKAHGQATDREIPATVTYEGVTYDVVGISDWGLFADDKKIQTVTFEGPITHIGERCFQNCSDLISVKIPNGVSSIGNKCFMGSGITTLTLPNTVSSVGDECFMDCSRLESITISGGTPSFGTECFRNCSNLTSITFSGGVPSLGSRCFQNCSSLKSITIPDGVSSISNMCFLDCSSLEEATIPSSVTSIGTQAFPSSLKNLRFYGSKEQWNNVYREDDSIGPNTYVAWHCTLTFDANGHGTPPAAIEDWRGSVHLLPSDISETGWTFLDWSTTPDGTGDKVVSLKFEDNMTVYAMWVENIHARVSFVANGGEGTMDAVEYEGPGKCVLPNCSFHRPKYLFAGWSTTPSGPVEYQRDDTIVLEDGQDITLYAVWTQSLIGGIPPCDGGRVYLAGIPWRLIGASDTKWLLITEDVQGKLGAGGEKLDWQGINDANTRIYDQFTLNERTAVISSTTKNDDLAYYREAGVFDWNYKPSNLSNAKLFSLSASEADTYFSSSDDRKPGEWWLRSEMYIIENDNYVYWGVVNDTGDLYATVAYERDVYRDLEERENNGGDSLREQSSNMGIDSLPYYARPVFQLNLDSVLFSSAASGGKSTADAGSGEFGAFRESAEEGRKLTLFDNTSTRHFFTAKAANTTVAPGGTVALTYDKAFTGTGEYVSAMLCNADGKALYYASLKSAESGKWDLALPADLACGSYTLKVFSEKQNDSTHSDVASPAAPITLKVIPSIVDEPRFNGHALLLDGKVGLQFYLELPTGKDAGDYPDGYVTLAGNKLNAEERLPLSDAAKEDMPDGTTRYVFTAGLSSIQLADEVTPTFHPGGDGAEVAGGAYSVQDYLEWALGDGSSSLTDAQAAVVKALADYGYYAQRYCSVQNGWTIGREYAEQTFVVNMDRGNADDCESVLAATEQYALAGPYFNWGPGNIIPTDILSFGHRLIFGSTLTLEMRFKWTDGLEHEEANVDYEVVPLRASDGYLVASIRDIYATALTKTMNVTADDCELNISPMSYVHAGLSRGTSSNEFKSLLCALYHYGKACEDCV